MDIAPWRTGHSPSSRTVTAESSGSLDLLVLRSRRCSTDDLAGLGRPDCCSAVSDSRPIPVYCVPVLPTVPAEVLTSVMRVQVRETQLNGSRPATALCWADNTQACIKTQRFLGKGTSYRSTASTTVSSNSVPY